MPLVLSRRLSNVPGASKGGMIRIAIFPDIGCRIDMVPKWRNGHGVTGMA
jgi:hypothetical protein